ncbi:MAG TPA: CheR family methyltransferase, partial [Polyangia bacterium]|nr:CheR family methyltransferase [Polyangia bacterium]
MAGLSMSHQLFIILSALVRERAGLHFDETHLPIFAEKVAARATEAGFESLLDYYYFLRYDPGASFELDRLIDALVVNETYLLRELPPLEIAVEALRVKVAAGGPRPRIWCAACATGDEPLTLAMLLAQHGLLDAVDLVASDISAAALERARCGRLGRRAIRGELPPFASRWVTTSERDVNVDARLVEAVTWRRINLVDDASVTALGSFDFIFCRNVLIYFSDETARRVVERLAARLVPGGALFVGISESLLRLGTSLRCEELD